MDGDSMKEQHKSLLTSYERICDKLKSHLEGNIPSFTEEVLFRREITELLAMSRALNSQSSKNSDGIILHCILSSALHTYIILHLVHDMQNLNKCIFGETSSALSQFCRLINRLKNDAG